MDKDGTGFTETYIYKSNDEFEKYDAGKGWVTDTTVLAVNYYFISGKLKTNSNNKDLKLPNTFQQVDSMIAKWGYTRLDRVEEWNRKYDSIHNPMKPPK